MARRNLRNVDERILSRVIHEGSSNGVNNISTKKIASSLRITEPTIYVHFQNKENLIATAYRKAFAALYSQMEFHEDKNLHSAFERNVLILLQNAKRYPEEAIYVFNYHHLNSYHTPDPANSETGKAFYKVLSSIWNGSGKNGKEADERISRQVYAYTLELMDLFAYEAAIGTLDDDLATAKLVNAVALAGLQEGKALFLASLNGEEETQPTKMKA